MSSRIQIRTIKTRIKDGEAIRAITVAGAIRAIRAITVAGVTKVETTMEGTMAGGQKETITMVGRVKVKTEEINGTTTISKQSTTITITAII
jgi:hypothetical protein